jgi:dethiobiotin synthetase
MAGMPEYYYWKPIQSGLEPATDSETVSQLADLPPGRVLSEAYKFKAPLSPHAAAALEETTVDKSRLALPARRPLIVEGAGGVLVPLNREELYADVFQRWNLPVIVVTRSTLGTINHTLLTLEALRRRNIEVLGCIVNGPRNRPNEHAIEQYGNTEVLGVLEPVDNFSPDILNKLFGARLARVREVLA